MFKRIKKIRCWFFEHVWFVDGASPSEAICIYCGKVF